jgi:uncharacterized membrane protein
MKKFLAFLKWHWDSWTFGQKVYIIGGFFVGVGFKDFMETGTPPIAMQIGFAIWFSILLKWFFWDSIRDSWKRFEQERRDVFKTIDEGK